jgi:DNA-binding CsgD family transcriptional regulator
MLGKGNGSGSSPWASTGDLPLSFVFDDLVDSLGTAIVVIDGGHSIRGSNRAGRKLLSELDGVVTGGPTLEFCRPALNQKFQSLCAAVGRDARSSACPVTRILRVQRPDDRPDLILLVHARPVWSEGAVLVVMMNLDLRVEATDLLKELNGFTRSESIVVQRLLGGSRLAEIGRQLDMAPETVRAHVKRAFKKCRVHSQSQLVQCVALQLFTLVHLCALE